MKFTSLRTSGIRAVVGIALAASLLGASTVAAQSISLAQLTALLTSLGISSSQISAAVSALGTTNTTTSSGYNYTRSLTVGSTGADVTALQNTLIANGDLASGLNTGYFGALTQAGVAKWQASVGITPAVGYFGPISIAKLGASSSMTTTTTTTTSTSAPSTSAPSSVAGCTPGAMFSSTTGAACATSSTVTNTGVEGILTVNLNPTPSSGQNVYEGDSMDSLIGIQLQAQLSPITIQRVQVDLGDSTAFYTKVFPTLYLVSDTGQTLAQASLNGNTVTKQTNSSGGNEYYLNFSGFNYTVPGDNSIHVLTVKGDVYGSIDTSDDSGGLQQYFTNGSVPISIPVNGIRGVDGAGVDQYGPIGSAITNSVLVQNSLTDSAQLQISTDASTPLAQTVVASSGANDNEADGVTVLTFDAYAQKDAITFDSISGTTVVTATSSTASALPTTAYLYAGSQQIGSSAITFVGTTGTFSFNNMSYTVPVNTTQALTIKEDIKGAGSAQVSQTTTILASGINAENSVGNTITSGNLTGSATGNQLSVIATGPVFTLVGTPTISSSQSPISNNTSTSTLQANFTLNIQAVGGNLFFGTQAASSTFVMQTYVSGVSSTVYNASTTSWSIPSSGVVSTGLTGANAFELQQNNSVQIPITYLLTGKTTAGAAISTSQSYAVGLNGINWSTTGNTDVLSNFMAGQLNWRTGTLIFP
ncbi:MAG TPA: peptidoglycan-binding protein [Candidatus Paceibacterota bacterium]|nr:peptidoglycan-binding protein [Candidatus Paceibacterota bacterium]